MKFDLLDTIVTLEPARIVAVKQVSRAEEYLGDHFPDFPVLPGVFMVETMVQAARRLLGGRTDERLVLGTVRALRFGRFVSPGEALEVEVTVGDRQDDGSYPCKGRGRVRGADGPVGSETAVSGRFTMRPVRVARTQPASAAGT